MSTSTSNMSKFIQGSASRHRSASRSVTVFWTVYLAGVTVLGVIVILAGITPAWSATPEARSITVSFRDLNLSEPAGAKTLYGRIQTAAKQVCGRTGADFIEMSTWRSCYRHAVDEAVRKVNNPLLTAVHTGRTPTMTAMLSKK
jgi:UrcA family protein